MIPQTLHGYDQGHRLLAVGGELSAAELEAVGRLSDLSGYLPAGMNFRCYYSGFPCGTRYAFACTWPDLEAPRGGAVFTHSFLLDLDSVASLGAVEQIHNFFVQPKRGFYDDFRHPLPPPQLPPVGPELPLPPRLTAGYFGSPNRPIYWVGRSPLETAIFGLWRRLDPQTRTEFSFCTLTLQPRRLKEGPFHVLGVPIEARSAFHQERTQPGWIEEVGTGALPSWAEPLSAPGAMHALRQRAQRDGLPNPPPTEIPALARFYELEEGARQRLTAARTRADLLARLHPGTEKMPLWEPVLVDLLRLQDQAPLQPRPFWDLIDLLRRPQLVAMRSVLGPLIQQVVYDETARRMRVETPSTDLPALWEAAGQLSVQEQVERSVEGLVQYAALSAEDREAVALRLYEQVPTLILCLLRPLSSPERGELLRSKLHEEGVAELAHHLKDPLLLVKVRRTQQKPCLKEALSLATDANREAVLYALPPDEVVEWWLTEGAFWALGVVVHLVGDGSSLAAVWEEKPFGPTLLEEVTKPWPEDRIQKLFEQRPKLCLRVLREKPSPRLFEAAVRASPEDSVFEATELSEDSRVVAFHLRNLLGRLLVGPPHPQLPAWCASTEVQRAIGRLKYYHIIDMLPGRHASSDSLKLLLDQAEENSIRLLEVLNVALRTCDRATLEKCTEDLLKMGPLPLAIAGEILGAVRRVLPADGYRLVERVFPAVYLACDQDRPQELIYASWWSELRWNRAKSWRHWLVDTWISQKWPSSVLERVIAIDPELQRRARKRWASLVG